MPCSLWSYCCLAGGCDDIGGVLTSIPVLCAVTGEVGSFLMGGDIGDGWGGGVVSSDCGVGGR